jgi:hypothetical protein
MVPELNSENKLFDRTISQGYTSWAGNSSMHSIVFFDGIRVLMAGLLSKQTLARMRENAILEDIDLNSWPRGGLEFAPLNTRREAFRFLARVLENWPERFVELIHNCRLRYSDLQGDAQTRPYWYDRVLRSESFAKLARVSPVEIDAIASYTEVSCGRLNTSHARHLSGRDISRHIKERVAQRVSDEIYEDLLTSLDHEISGTTNIVERICLIRDKIMFACARQFNLSQSELAALTLEQVTILSPTRSLLDFTEAAHSRTQARAWAEWYWEQLRPRFQPLDDTSCVFTSYITHRKMSKSAIGARFIRAVDSGMLKRSIPDYTCWVKPTSITTTRPLLSTEARRL